MSIVVREPAPVNPAAGDSRPPDGWSMGLASTHLLTALVIDRIDAGQPDRDAVLAVWAGTESPFRVDVLGYIAGFGVETFDDWVSLCSAGSPLPMPAIEPAPYVPTDADWAELDAYLASLHRDDHDQQPDPNDLIAFTIRDEDWWEGIEGPEFSRAELIEALVERAVA